MPTLHQYDYIFAFGTIFAALDAYCIGANDVANSWATAVSSKVFTLRQACVGAAIFEFLGAVTAGARVTGTIKSGIIPGSVFEGSAPLQLLGFTVALFCSSTWLLLATRLGWPVSTTYSIVSAIVGVGIAVGGWDAPNWGWENAKGLAAIWAGLFIAPALAAGFAAACYLLVKFLVLRNANPTRMGLIAGPFFFFVVAAVCTMSIVYKGAPQLHLDKLSQGTVAAAIVGTASVVAALSILFWVPFVRQRVIKKDYTLRWYHFFLGPLLWSRPAPEDADTVDAHVTDYRNRAVSEAEEKSEQDSASAEQQDPEKLPVEGTSSPKPKEAETAPGKTTPSIEGPFILPRNLWIIVRYKIPALLLHGSSVDIHKMQVGEAGSKQEAHMREVLGRAKQYPNETEHLFSFLQAITACTASFAHGSNDLANAIGPWSVIYYTWKNGILSGSESPVPVWQLVWGACALVLGLATYGYNIMAVLGNRITLMSPSRGFTAELGAAITVILASQYSLPASSTMCLTGGLLGVGLCNGNLWAINWRQIGWIYLGWIGTIVVVAIYSACTMAVIINAPRWPGTSNA